MRFVVAAVGAVLVVYAVVASAHVVVSAYKAQNSMVQQIKSISAAGD